MKRDVFLSVAGFLFAIMCFFCNVNVQGNTDLNSVFNQRTDEEWRQVWHTERHRRCYQELWDHMTMVCQKDIYKVSDKRDGSQDGVDQFADAFNNNRDTTALMLAGRGFPVLTTKHANDFFRRVIPDYRPIETVKRQRMFKRGIIEECCQGPTGCSWEEYAEYCTANRRIRA